MATRGYDVGDIVPWHFSPGIVVASFLASLLGTTLTVELLHRKRTGRNLVSRVQIILCAAAMGLIGVWCMHFIGNRSIILADGASELQMVFSPGYSFLSCLLPVIGLSFAFYIAECRISNALLHGVFVIICGVIAGVSIVAMHYVGNLGTKNYKLIYPRRYIVASSIIAIGDSMVALALFFYFQQKWINIFWKRFACATLLAVAVCGMHYTASVGCTYELKALGGKGTSRNTAVIVAAVLCLVAAMAGLCMVLYTNLRNKQLQDKAQQVNIACAYFDKDGKVLVNNEGIIPTQKIAKRFNVQHFDEEFTTAHPVFHWIWKISNDWSAVSDLIPGMRAHLRRFAVRVSRPTSSSSDNGSFMDEESGDDQTLLFRQSFCVASADLAARLGVQLSQLGSLYDRITGTGLTPSSVKEKNILLSDVASIASANIFEKGQVLFFTQTLSNDEVEEYIAKGYRFAPATFVEGTMAKVMQVPIQSVSTYIKSLHEYALSLNAGTIVKNGTYITCFAALGRVNRYFDIIVSRAHQDQLPDVQLAPQHLNKVQLQYLEQYDGMTAGDMMTDLKTNDHQTTDAETKDFAISLFSTMSKLSDQVNEEWFPELIFNAKPIISQYDQSKTPNAAMVLGLTKMLNIHHSLLNISNNLTLVPLEFFRVRAAYFPGSPKRLRFRTQVHVEFAPLFTKSITNGMPYNEKDNMIKTQRMFANQQKSPTNKSDVEIVVDDDKSLRSNGGRGNSDDVGKIRPLMWGGILATTDTILVQGSVEESNLSDLLKRGVSPLSFADSAGIKDEDKTYADLLYARAKARATIRPNGQNSISS